MDHRTLIDAATLASRLDDPDWVIFDCRHELAAPDSGEAAYRESHIPGARFLHLDRDLSSPQAGRGTPAFRGRHPLPDAQALATRLGAAGVHAGAQIVAYDAQGGMAAARLWWLARWLGHDRVAVLDGGWQAWQRAGLPVSDRIPAPVAREFTARPRPVHVTAERVRAELGSAVLVDARASDRHRGMNETLDPVGGRIPGARNRFFALNLGADGRFKPRATLRAEFEALLEGTPPAEVVHYCGSGVSACHNLLALEAAGLSGGRLYPGSWSEWCADPTRPVANGEPRPGEAGRR